MHWRGSTPRSRQRRCVSKSCRSRNREAALRRHERVAAELGDGFRSRGADHGDPRSRATASRNLMSQTADRGFRLRLAKTRNTRWPRSLFHRHGRLDGLIDTPTADGPGSIVKPSRSSTSVATRERRIVPVAFREEGVAPPMPSRCRGRVVPHDARPTLHERWSTSR